jgi:hypothetical protein
MDNTAQDQAPIIDQDTLEQALSAPVEEKQPEPEVAEPTTKQDERLYLGKYKSPEELEKGYTNLQARATKAEQKLKELEAEAKKAKLESIKGLGYDEQVQFLMERITDMETQNNELRGLMLQSTEEATAQSDFQQMETFIKSKPELVETGMDKIFREYAQHPDLKQVTFESIYNDRFAPAINKLMGTKVSVKERPIRSESKKVDAPVDISRMSNTEYEKHRVKLLRDAGISGI